MAVTLRGGRGHPFDARAPASYGAVYTVASHITASAGGQLPILIVENDDLFGRSLLRVVQSLGHDAELVANVNDAKRVLTAGVCSMVLTDVDLPDGDGFDVLAACERVAVPCIAMSGRMTPDRKQALLAAGAHATLGKPFSPEALDDALRPTHD